MFVVEYIRMMHIGMGPNGQWSEGTPWNVRRGVTGAPPARLQKMSEKPVQEQEDPGAEQWWRGKDTVSSASGGFFSGRVTPSAVQEASPATSSQAAVSEEPKTNLASSASDAPQILATLDEGNNGGLGAEMPAAWYDPETKTMNYRAMETSSFDIEAREAGSNWFLAK